jgi:antitoxin HicB
MGTTKKTLNEYLTLKYPFTVHSDPDGGFVGEIAGLPGCLTQAESPAELFEMMEDAKKAWITTAFEMGQDIPLPVDSDQFKGKILLRIPRRLHRDLASIAASQSVSLNQYAAYLLAAGVQGDLLNKQTASLQKKRETGKYLSNYLNKSFSEGPQIPIVRDQ